MSGETFTHQLYAQFARTGKALAHGNRLEFLEILSHGERSVETLARACELSVANTSQHLQQLRKAGLVCATKRAQHVYYRLSDESVVELLAVLRQVARSTLSDVGRLLKNENGELQPLDGRDLLQRLDNGVTVVDVRPAEEYAAGHVPGALNVPLERLERYLDQLSADAEVVAYCRDPYCLLAYEAVRRLRQQGIAARPLREGFAGWQRAGYPVDTQEVGAAPHRAR
ncbi:MAG: metalloregulator ArsR/SmtB family transcription factor [Gammaproteobacteria bacterium]